MSVHLEIVEDLYFLVDMNEISWKRIQKEENIIVQSEIPEQVQLKERKRGRKAVRMLKAKEVSSFEALKLYLEERGLNPAGAMEMFGLLSLHDPKAILQGRDVVHLLAPDTVQYGKNILMATVQMQWTQVGRGNIPYGNYDEYYRIICIEN
ncbi:MAG: hypothetical protein ABEJ02_01080 [Candidatus Paceibacteria bacterium]